MAQGANTPEELDALMEDAFVLRSGGSVAALFEEGGLLAVGTGAHPARGERQIARAAAAIWDGPGTYVAEPRRVLQARGTALHVTRRAPDGSWRLAVSLVRPCRPHAWEEDS